jgi:hypothetical protein
MDLIQILFIHLYSEGCIMVALIHKISIPFSGFDTAITVTFTGRCQDSRRTAYLETLAGPLSQRFSLIH